MARNALSSRILLALVVVVVVMASKSQADPTIIVNTPEQVTVNCNTNPPTSWTMSSTGVKRVTVPLPARPGIINCGFSATLGGVAVQQSVTVEPTAVASVECMPDSCQWTVQENGFFVYDIVSETEVLGYPWMS